MHLLPRHIDRKMFVLQGSFVFFFINVCFPFFSLQAQDRQIPLTQIYDRFGGENLGATPKQGTIGFFVKLNSKKEIMDAFTTAPLNGCIDGNHGFRFEFIPWGNVDTGFAVVIGNDSSNCSLVGKNSLNRYRFLNPSSFEVNTWYHVAITWDIIKNNAKGYLNGKEVFNYTTTKWPTRYYEVKFGIGFDTLRKWDGGLAELGMWNRAFNSAEVFVLSKGLVNLNDDDLKKYWNFPSNYSHDNHNNLLNSSANYFLQDHKGFIWIATTDGLKRYDGFHNRQYFPVDIKPDSAQNNFICALFEDSRQRIWVGTLDEGIFLFRKYSNQFYSFNKNLKQGVQKLTEVWNITEDKYGSIYVKAKQGHYCLNEQTNQFEKCKTEVPGISKKVYSSARDANGNEWLATEEGVKFYDRSENILYSNTNNPQHISVLNILSPVSAAIDKENNLWISCNSNATLYKYNINDKKLLSWLFPYSLGKNNYNTTSSKTTLGVIFIDSHNTVWLSLPGTGLVKYNSVANNFVLVAADDRNANNYDSSFIPFNQNYPMMEDKEGNLWVGGFTNFIWLHPNNKNDSLPPANVTLTDFHSYDKTLVYIPGYPQDSLLDYKMPIHLDYRHNNFDIQYASLHFHDPYSLKYFTRMDGVDRDWVDGEANRTGAYHDLEPGHYYFHVKCVNGIQIPCEKETVLEIIIDPPLWQTWWFKVLMILLAGASVYLLALLQSKYIRKREAAKNARALRMMALEAKALRSQMNPHFIFNCLNSIKLYTTQNDTVAAAEYLTKFSRLIRLVLQNSRDDRIILISELDALGLYIEMEAMRFKEKLTYNISIEKNVDVNYIEIPPLLLQPYVENAIWHGLMQKQSGGHIGINVAMVNGKSMLGINIIDNGIGRAKAAELKSKSAIRQKSFGMKVTSERIALINQLFNTNTNVQIIDLMDGNGEAAGTQVIIQIPV